MHTHPIRITQRRLQIASLRAHGHGVKATARILRIQPNTVNSHCDAILFDTKSVTFTQAVYKLTKQGLITLFVCILTMVFYTEGDKQRRHARRLVQIRYEQMA